MSIIVKELKYSDFLLCKEEYPYLEDKSINSEKCKKEIQEWLMLIMTKLEKIDLHILYDLKNNKEVDAADIVYDENFLFYSHEKGTEQRSFVITKKDRLYKSEDDWYEKHEDDLLLTNDHDGIGLGLVGDKKILNKIDQFNLPLWNLMDEHRLIR